MSDLIESKQAADALGVTEDELNEMRLRGEIHGVRDGSSWKFKSDEIERVAGEKGISPSGGDVTDEDDELDLGGLEPAATSDLELDLEAGDASDAPTAIGTLEDFEAEPTGESGLALSSDPEDDDAMLLLGAVLTLTPMDNGVSGQAWSGEVHFQSTNGWSATGSGTASWVGMDQVLLTTTLDTVSLDWSGSGLLSRVE